MEVNNLPTRRTDFRGAAERRIPMQENKSGKRTLIVVGIAALSALCLFLGWCWCAATRSVLELEGQAYSIYYDCYCDIENLYDLSKPDDLDEERMKKLELRLERICHGLELGQGRFSLTFGEDLSYGEVDALIQYFKDLQVRVGAARARGEVSPEDKEFFLAQWGVIDRRLHEPELYRQLYEYTQAQNV